MFFRTREGGVYHILEDAERGAAPSPCGSTLKRGDRILLAEGKPTPNVVKEKPADAPLCKHCEKSPEGSFRGSQS